jgi:hypothetical protein
MLPARRRFCGLPRWLFTLGVSLALVSQFGVLAAQIGEMWQGPNTASHVEPVGTSRHFAHNDAMCPACQARSTTSAASRPVTAILMHEQARSRPAVAFVAAPPSRTPSHSQPRAPPTLG